MENQLKVSLIEELNIIDKQTEDVRKGIQEALNMDFEVHKGAYDEDVVKTLIDGNSLGFTDLYNLLAHIVREDTYAIADMSNLVQSGVLREAVRRMDMCMKNRLNFYLIDVAINHNEVLGLRVDKCLTALVNEPEAMFKLLYSIHRSSYKAEVLWRTSLDYAGHVQVRIFEQGSLLVHMVKQHNNTFEYYVEDAEIGLYEYIRVDNEPIYTTLLHSPVDTLIYADIVAIVYAIIKSKSKM